MISKNISKKIGPPSEIASFSVSEPLTNRFP